MAPSDDEQLEYLSLNRANFEQVIRELLLVKNYRVEVYTCKKGRPNDWELEFKGSPGNLVQFEDILFGNKPMIAGNAIISVYLKVEGNQKVLNYKASFIVFCLDVMMNLYYRS